jgi:hypothetical protein
MRTPTRLLAVLLPSAAALRFALAIRGGQYFDWDEHRYGFSTLMLARLRAADLGGALDILFRYPEHPGFKIAGVGPAALQQWLHPAQTISDMRQPTGEWLAAFLFSLSSVAAIALTYAVGRRAGASERESLFAAFLMFASTSMLMHARHLFPYDLALALGLLAAWVALSPADRMADSVGAGVLAGAAFSTYFGSWLLAAVVLGVHVLWHPASPGGPERSASPGGPERSARRQRYALRRLRRATLFGIGAIVVPGMLVAASTIPNRPLLPAARRFAATVTHGQFAEGWSLPWAFFWHVEGFLLVIVAAGIVLSLRGPGRGPKWAAAAAALYTGLALGSNVFHRFVVYDRLARPMWPFMCLAAAAGIAAVADGRWLTGRRAYGLCAVVLALFVMNSTPLFVQRYPREIVHEVLARYGADQVGFDMTLQHAVDNSSGFLIPAEVPGTPKRYVLVNARDIWFEGEPATTPLPAGRVVATWRHPRQLRLLQYHGYTPAQRAFMRSEDASIRLIDRAGAAAAADHD